jgi:hypothetical protein
MVAELSMTSENWPIEFIPDVDIVFRRVHINDLHNWRNLEKIQPNIFRSDLDGMSVNWNKYATAEQTQGNNPGKNGLIQFNVGEIRAVPEQLNVIHSPTFENRSHSSVIDITPSNKAKTRKKLSLIASWAIKPTI